VNSQSRVLQQAVVNILPMTESERPMGADSAQDLMINDGSTLTGTIPQVLCG
jgi:hypothetical protein